MPRGSTGLEPPVSASGPLPPFCAGPESSPVPAGSSAAGDAPAPPEGSAGVVLSGPGEADSSVGAPDAPCVASLPPAEGGRGRGSRVSVAAARADEVRAARRMGGARSHGEQAERGGRCEQCCGHDEGARAFHSVLVSGIVLGAAAGVLRRWKPRAGVRAQRDEASGHGAGSGRWALHPKSAVGNLSCVSDRPRAKNRTQPGSVVNVLMLRQVHVGATGDHCPARRSGPRPCPARPFAPGPCAGTPLHARLSTLHLRHPPGVLRRRTRHPHRPRPPPAGDHQLHAPRDRPDAWTWARHKDVVSVDVYPDPTDPHAAQYGVMIQDMTRSQARGGPWMVMGQAAGAVNFRSVDWAWQRRRGGVPRRRRPPGLPRHDAVQRGRAPRGRADSAGPARHDQLRPVRPAVPPCRRPLPRHGPRSHGTTAAR